MIRMNKALKLGVLAAAAVGALALSAPAASAHIACNRYGECWHTSARYTNYPRGLGIRFHDDSWQANHQRRYRWRDNPQDDHGYYAHGQWRGF